MVFVIYSVLCLTAIDQYLKFKNHCSLMHMHVAPDLINSVRKENKSFNL